MVGADGGSPQSGSASAGCGCNVPARDGQARTMGLGAAGLLGVMLRRRRRQR
jgi:MYXO-CTERM domain-containing protein